MVARTLLLATVVAVVTGSGYADSRQIITIDTLHSVTRLDDEEWSAAGLARAEVDLQSTGNRRARGRLRANAQASADGSTTAEVDRAFVKVRFPFLEDRWFHLTVGRARLSWGDGAYYNAADTLYGVTGGNVDFTEDTLRDEASWIAAAFFPLGDYAFVEPLLLVPGPNVLSETPTPPEPEDSAGGLRIQGKLGDIKAEVGYLYDGGVAGGNNPGATDAFGDLHRPAASVQGNLGVDWYVSGSTALPGALSKAPEDHWWRELATSVGFLHIHSFPSGAGLSLRLETLVRPGGEWEAAPNGLETGERYGVSLFPEVVWTPNATVSVYLRSLISPLDASGQITPGFRWNAVEGATIYSFVNLAAGEVSDSYGLGKPGGVAFLAGLQYVF